jgi:hypothetical protein
MESFSFRRSSFSGKLHFGYLIQGCRKCLWYLFRNWLFAARFLWMGCHLSIRCFISLLFSKLWWLMYIFPIMLAMRSIICLFGGYPTCKCVHCLFYLWTIFMCFVEAGNNFGYIYIACQLSLLIDFFVLLAFLKMLYHTCSL